METHKLEFFPNRGTTIDEQKIYKSLAHAWPIRPAVDFKPSWHTNLNKTYQHTPESPPQPTAKACPGIFDHMKAGYIICLLYTSPSPRDATLSRMPSSA